MLGFEGSWQLELQDIPEYVDIVIAGDVHQFNVTRTPTGKLFISPGATSPRSIAEIDSTYGYIMLDGRKEVKRLLLKSRQFFTAQNDNELKKYIEEAQQLNALNPALPPVIFITSELANIVPSEKNIIFSVRNQPKLPEKEFVVESLAGVGSCSLVDKLPAVVNKTEEPDVFNLLTTLLNTPIDNAQTILNEWVEVNLKSSTR
jgi:hypothetical protein